MSQARQTAADADTLSVAECAAFLDMPEDKARRIIRSAALTPVRTARGIGYARDDVAALVRRHH